jgi:two-component system, NtrC family, sensor histidine kinase KinB
MGNENASSLGNDRTAAILDNLDEAALLLDAADSLTHLNPRAAEVLGVDRERIVGLPLSAINSHCLNCARICLALEQARTSGLPQPKVQLGLTANGRDQSYVLKAASIRANDIFSGTLVLLHDISPLSEASPAQGTGIAAVAEYLNTPLTSLSLAVGLLQREGEKQNDLVRQILGDIDRLNHSSADFLNRMREQPRSMSVRNVRFDLTDAFHVIFRKLAGRIDRKKIAFAIHAEKNLCVGGDPLKLSWVIATLAGNAVSHTPEGGKVDLTAEKEDSFVRVCVWDSGPGIPAQTREAIFDGLDDETQSPGAGFSLIMAKEVVEAHGGRLFAEKFEDGARVTFTVPLAQEV